MALLEAANALDSKIQRRGSDSRQGIGHVARQRPVNFADESQRQVQLLLVLPVEIGTVVHGVDEQVANLLGRTNGDEQAMHEVVRSRRERRPPNRLQPAPCPRAERQWMFPPPALFPTTSDAANSGRPRRSAAKRGRV